MKRHAIFIAVLALCSVASANVIFPAFTAPYVAGIFFPQAIILALVTEGAVYKALCRVLRLRVVVVLVLLVNAVSWLAGVVIGSFLPSGLINNEQGILTSGPSFNRYALLGFVLAYVLSVIIEYGALRIASSRVKIESPFRLSFAANTASDVPPFSVAAGFRVRG